MNRPNKKDDPNYPFEFPDTYLGELEKYCDELEDHIKLLEDNIIRLSKEFVKINKALDKACKYLEEANYEEFENIEYDVDMGMLIKTPVKANAEEWKEWLLKDE